MITLHYVAMVYRYSIATQFIGSMMLTIARIIIHSYTLYRVIIGISYLHMV